MANKAIVHIGTEKTGTTSLQKFLYINRERLKKINYLYPVSINNAGAFPNTALSAYCANHIHDYHLKNNIKTLAQKDAFNKELKINFLKELKSNNGKDLIISSEHFHSRVRTIKGMQRLKDILRGYNIKIVIYLRPQVDMAISHYSTALKSSNSTQTLTEYIKHICKIDNYYCNYKKILDNWSAVFGKENLIVRLYSRQELQDGDIIKDFLHLSGVSDNISDFIFPDKENTSINIIGQQLVLALNKLESDDHKKEYFKKNILNLFKGTSEYPEPTLIEKIQSQFEEMNHIIKEEWFPNHRSILNINLAKYSNNHPDNHIQHIAFLKNIITQTIPEIWDGKSDFKKHIAFQKGVYSIEDWGFWTKGDEIAKLIFQVNKQLEEEKLTFKITARYISKNTQSYMKLYDGTWELLENEKEYQIPINTIKENSNLIEINFKHKNAISPKELGVNNDIRVLGCGIESILFY